MVRGEVAAELTDDTVRIRFGALGRADIPVALIDRLGTMRWTWWGGIGVRLGRRLVAYTLAWGPVALIELAEPIDVKAPLRWRTPRIVLGVDDVDGFIHAVAHARAAAGAARELGPTLPSR
jgi:hypothetical protein